MNGPPTQDALELQVTNFGPIVEARVDLRPLTVFVGPSNTGKSYLAILIYALHRFFSGNAGSGLLRFRRRYPISRGLEVGNLPDATIDALREAARTLLALREAPDRRSVVLPSPVADLIRSGFDAGGDALGREIGRCFGIDNAGALIRRGRRNGARIVLRRPVSEDSTSFEHMLTLVGRTTEFRTKIPAEILIQVNPVIVDQMDEYIELIDNSGSFEGEDYVFLRFSGFLNDLILPHLADPLHLPAYYLPADRTGVMHAHSVVVGALIGSAPMAGLRPAARTPMLSGVLADFLEQLIEIDRPWRSLGRRGSDLGARIEEAILGGSVRVDRSPAVGYPRFAYRPDGWKDDLPLMNASSMVSELAPVVLYLRHMVGPGNVLIVEEPESHLHPAMQVEFTRQLAALVGAGVRVIVTTHSEWLIEELANIVRRSRLPEVDRTDGDVALRPDQVGVWLFQPKGRPKGSVVTESRLDDSGLYSSGFADVAAALHNDWADISSRIGEGE